MLDERERDVYFASPLDPLDKRKRDVYFASPLDPLKMSQSQHCTTGGRGARAVILTEGTFFSLGTDPKMKRKSLDNANMDLPKGDVVG
jgi:hypothetical protein